MDITRIPFVAKTGVVKNAQGELSLRANADTHNHLQTIHAGALFTLAESASGELLFTRFPDLAERVVPLLRDAQVKYRRAAEGSVSAHAMVSADAVDAFREQLAKKGRAAITVAVDVKNSEGVVTCSASFNWFVQTLAAD